MRATLVCGLVACALAAAACGRLLGEEEQRRVVVLNPQPPGPVDVRVLAEKLARETHVHVEVRDVSVLSAESIREVAARTVAEKPALIVAPAADMVFSLREYTHAIPILFVTLADPIDSSFVTDAQRPRGNVSGYSFHVPIESKQLEILKRAFPRTRRVGVLGDRYAFSTTAFREMARAATDVLDLELVRVHFQEADEVQPAVARALAAGVDAWAVPQGGTTYRLAPEIVAALRATPRPAIYGHDRFVKLGGLMSYSQAFEDPSDRVVSMAASILQGFPVGELPVEHPQNFRFAINVAAWRAVRPTPPAKFLKLATDFYGLDEAPRAR
jgi:ABC-type uncharacterized transport system substrate-binding protein